MSQRPRLSDMLSVAVFWGVATGLAEIATHKYQRTITLSALTTVNSHSWWMTPTANALLFLAVAIVLFGLSRGMPRVVTFKRCLAVLIFLGCLDLLLLVRSLHSMAAVLLALGLAKFGSDLLCSASKANAIRVLRWLVGLRTTSSATEGSVEGTPPELSVDRRRVLWAAAAAIGAPALAISAWNWDEERRQLARIPKVGAGRPNVLLLVLDTVRAANLSLYGYARPTTPHLDRLAGGATCFEWAIAGAPWTLPSHAVMFTGQHAHLLNCGFETPLNRDHPTLAETLAARGYATAGFVANTQYCARNWGVGRGFVHYEDMPYTLERLGMSSNLIRSVLTADRVRRWTGTDDYYARSDAAEINRRLLRWVDQNQHTPFFAFVNYFEAHAPYCPPRPFDRKFGPPRPVSVPPFIYRAEHEHPDAPQGWLTPTEIQIERDAYDGSIAYLDQEIGRLFEQLEERGILDDTLVIVVGDHGEEFAEHGMMEHSNSLYLPSLHVPLIVSWVGRVPQNARVTVPVSLRDLPHTVMTMIDPHAERCFPGESWSNRFNGSSVGSSTTPILQASTRKAIRKTSWYPASRGNMRSVCIGNYHCIFNGDQTVEVYDFVADPWETHNLADRPEGREVISDARRQLDA